MKGKLIRIAVAVNNAAEAYNDFNELFGVQCYGPYDDEHVQLQVCLPRSGGMEFTSPMSPDDPIGFSKYLEEKGEGFKGLVFQVDDLDEALAELKEKGIEPLIVFNHGPMREAIIPAQPKTHNLEVALNEVPSEDPVGIYCARDMGYDPFE